MSAAWTDGQADSFTILSKSGGECKVKYENISGAVVTDGTGSAVSFTTDGEDMIVFDTTEGGTYTIAEIPEHSTVQDASNLTLNVTQDKQLEVSWTASPDAVSYNIYRAEESAAVYEIYAEGVTGTSYTGEFKEGVQATYKLTAVSADGTESKGIYLTFVPTAKADSAKGYFLEDGSLQVQVEDSLRTDGTEYVLYKAEDSGYTELLRTPYTVMQLEGLTEDDKLALSRVEYTGESKMIDVEYLPQVEENVCLNKSATADRGTVSNYPISNALDGNLSSRLGFSGNGEPITMVIDLENVWDLDTLMIREWKDNSLSGGTRSGSTKCEVSTDGETWETVFEDEPLAGGENVEFDIGGRSALMIRLTFDNLESDKAVSIYEIQCSAKKDIYDKLELFQTLVRADQYEEDPVYGVGVDDEWMAAYEQAKEEAVDILEGRKGASQGDVDTATENLKNALAAIMSDAEELLTGLIEEAEEAVRMITPEHEMYVQENYDQLTAALNTAKAALENAADEAAMRTEAQQLDTVLRIFKGENIPGTISVDLASGIYDTPQQVNITSDSSAVTEYRYTLDGSEPDRNSPEATGGTLTLPYGLSVLKAAGYTETGVRTETVTVKYMCRSENNLALGQQAEASGTGYSQYPASYAVDGDTSTRWASRGRGVSFTITFDSPLVIDAVYVDEFKNSSNTQDNRLYAYTLEYQQEPGGEWSKISSGSVYDAEGRVIAVAESSHSYVALGFDPVTASALRITGPDDDEISVAPITFYEVEVYGEDLANALSDLNQALREAEAKDPAEYTAASAAELEAAVSAAKEMLASDSADDIRAAAGALRMVLNSLEKAKAIITDQPDSLSVVSGEEAELTVTAEGNSLGYQWQRYDGQIWRTIEGAIDATYRFTVSEEDNGAQYRCIVSSSGGNVVTENAVVTVSEEQETVSKTTLEYFLNSVKEHLENGDVDNCVESVQKLFEEAIAEGDAVMADENATREEVVNAAWKLMNAIHALNMKSADKTDLEMAVELGGMIDLSKYVEAGQPAFTDALAAAKEVLADGDAMQDEADTAWDALVTAMENLRLKADKAALEALLNEVSGLDLSRYTEESAAVFRTALTSAQTVFADGTLSEADQQKVDDAVTALKEAKAGLAARADASGSGEQEGQAGGSGEAEDENQTSDISTAGSSSTGKGTDKNAGAVQTGDTAPVAAAGVMILLSAAGLAIMRKRAKR